MNQFWDLLDKLSSLIGLGTFIFSILIWIKVKQEQKRNREIAETMKGIQDYDKMYDTFEKVQTSNPAVLCISLLHDVGSIKKVVNNYLVSNDIEVKIIDEVIMDGIHGKEDIKNFIHLLRKKRRSTLAEATELRLFIAGPIHAGTLAGAIFDNWIPTLLYHKGPAGYEYWGPLLKR